MPLSALPTARFTRGDGGKGTANRWSTDGLELFNTACVRVAADRVQNASFDGVFRTAAVAARADRVSNTTGRAASSVVVMYNDLPPVHSSAVDSHN